MKTARNIVRRRLVCALMLALTLTLAGSIAQAAPINYINGSINLNTYWATINGPDLTTSTQFTAFAPAPDTLFLAGGLGDFAPVAYAPANTTPLDTTAPLTWTFNAPGVGIWTTFSLVTIDPTPSDGFIEFFLTGAFTPDPNGSLNNFAPSNGEMRLSLTKTGPSVSMSGTLMTDGTDVPEPATMSMLAIGALAMLKRRRRS
ncbi:MAG: PEP-CTERM sorting domain-containing protein [Phycisphaerales bacterium]|nr:PEP-CTERM sorting domain-containing protein [Phycisphaerales bacterium]